MHTGSVEKCRNIIENSRSVFSVLNDNEKEILKKGITCIIYKKGEVIFTEGDKPTGLIILAEGKVKIFKEGIGGREQIIRLARPVGFIGYRAFFAEELHAATAMAIEDSVTCSVNHEVMMSLLQSNINLSLDIIKSFATELGLSYNRTVTLTQKHIRGRLAESLIFLKDTYGYERDNSTIKIYLSREDIANLSNMTTSNAIRTLSSFASEGLLSLEGKKIQIIDMNRLQKVSEMG
jgi:CRP/FNR family transcriptional regulator, polysaccharide utilization system transcription regulator